MKNLFNISNQVNVALIVRKFSSMKGCVLCKYNPLLNCLTIFGDEDFLILSEKLMTIIENHYSKVLLESERLKESKKVNNVKHESITITKNIYDLIKSKIDSLRKQYSIRFDVKQKKENKMFIEWDYTVKRNYK